ncbi:P22_AR-like protein [Salipiger abyssi]|uniref:p22_AR-like protein n=2 Tax=Salipiger abyssi TaxID=1250539 RepID=A0A1P8UUS1_9RHOB|nr:P22_AR-like protein [Salipiger abyssi]
MPTPFGRGGDQEAVCIKLDLLNGWLFTIDTNRIKDDSVRQKVLTYQRECYRVLHDHFAGKAKHQGGGLADDEDLAQSRGSKLSQIKEVRMIFGAEAAAQLYLQFGFEIVPAMIDRTRQPTLFDYDQIKSVGTNA